MNALTFNIDDNPSVDQMYMDFAGIMPPRNEPSNLTRVLLCSHWQKQKYRELDFTGTTNGEAIQKLLTFYNHKTFRKNIGTHTLCIGFDKEGEFDKICLITTA
jgi:hypothetical protein